MTHIYNYYYYLSIYTSKIGSELRPNFQANIFTCRLKFARDLARTLAGKKVPKRRVNSYRNFGRIHLKFGRVFARNIFTSVFFFNFQVTLNEHEIHKSPFTCYAMERRVHNSSIFQINFSHLKSIMDASIEVMYPVD